MAIEASGFIGAGDVYLARYTDAGTPGPFVFAGDASRFLIKPNSTIKERRSRRRDQHGQVVDTVASPDPADFGITLSEATSENLALAFMGRVTADDVASTTVTGEAVTARLGQDVPLANQNIATAGVVVTNDGGTTTYADGTDYVVNHRLGMLRALNGGAIAQDQPLRVSYTTQAGDMSVIEGSVEPFLRARVLFDGINTVNKRPIICTVWEAVLTPSSPIDFLSEDWLDIAIDGRMKTPAGKTSPYEVRFFTPTP